MTIKEAPAPGSFCDAGTIADQVHRAKTWASLLDSQLFDAMINIFCTAEQRDDDNTWPCDDVTTDWYDNSIELIDCRDDLKLEPEHVDKILALGFSRFWLNWADGTQCYCARGHIGDRVKR